MPTSGSSFDRFLRAVHRRHAAVRAAESVGVCLLIAFAADLILLGIFIARGQSGWPIMGPSALIAMAAGIVVAVTRWPTVLQSAMEADRQLDLHDLISSALLTRSSRQQDPWAGAVMVMAESRCARLSPSAVVLNRLGARAWGGIGLSGALVLTLALMTGGPGSSLADGTKLAADDATQRAGEPDKPSAAWRSSPRAVPQTPVDANDPRGGDIESHERDGKVTNASREKFASEKQPGPSGLDTAGGGQAVSAPRLRESMQRSIGANGETTNADVGRIAITGESGRVVSDGSGERTARGGGRGVVTSPLAPVAPWQSNDWPARQEDAGRAIRSGEIPPNYHDVVRNYFDRQADKPVR